MYNYLFINNLTNAILGTIYLILLKIGVGYTFPMGWKSMLLTYEI
jgi:hypothetical protein